MNRRAYTPDSSCNSSSTHTHLTTHSGKGHRGRLNKIVELSTPTPSRTLYQRGYRGRRFAGTDLPLRMMLKDVFHPLLGADVGVNFCCKNAFMAKHLLYYAQIGPVFNQMCGK